MMRWLIGLLVLGNFLLYLWINLRPPAIPALPQPLPEVGELRIVGPADQESEAAAPRDVGPPPAAVPAAEEAPISAAPEFAAPAAAVSPPAPATSGETPMTAAPETAAPATGESPAAPTLAAGPPFAGSDRKPESSTGEVPESLPEAAVPGAPALPVEVVEAPAAAVAPSPPAEPLDEPGLAPPPESADAAPAPPGGPAAQPAVAATPGPAPAEPAEPDATAAVPLPAPSTAAQPATTTAPAEVAAVPLACGELRGFEQQAAADAVAGQLRAAGVTAEVLETLEQVESGYWVLIPPAPNRAAANASLDRLETAKVKDTWLVPAGPLKYAISLGLYTGRGRAAIRAEQIQELGLPAEVRPKLNDVTRYRIRYAGDEQAVEPVRAAALTQSGVTHEGVPCQ